jgi:DNA-binding CsgD family transcriptional regulator
VPLSHREVEVLRLVALGYSNKEVADELYISVRTVETHLGRIYRKLGVRSRSELSAYVAAGERSAREGRES